MNSVLSLQIHLRVPVRVKDNDRVSSLQVESQSSSPSTQQKHIELTIRLVEQLHPLLPGLCLSRPVQPQMPYTPVIEISLHYVHQVSHLGKDQQSVSESLEFRQNPVDKVELS